MLQEGDAHQLPDLWLSRKAVFQELQDARERGPVVYGLPCHLRFCPTLDIGHKQMWQHLAMLIADVLLE